MREKPKPYEAIIILIITIGIILTWLKIDTNGYIMTTGLLIIGVVYFIQEINIKSPLNFFRVARILLPLIVILLALESVIYGGVRILTFLVPLIMYSLISKRLVLSRK